MSTVPLTFLRFKHARFTARFPEGYRYSRSHYWMAPVLEEPGLWRVGFTKFATRMLGELVEYTFEKKEGDPVAPGEMVGWVEGFKAASDVFCTMQGHFCRSNPALAVDACLVREDPYQVGWLYEVRGEPEADSVDGVGYLQVLEEIISRMAAEEHKEEA